VALPVPIRNRLAGLILEAFHEDEARRALERLAAPVDGDASTRAAAEPPDAFPGEWVESWAGRRGGGADFAAYRRMVAERARRAWLAIAPRPPDPRDGGLEVAVAQAAVLFDADLYFEVHELLEPYWVASAGDTRRRLQGLIQIAVGFHHLANGNARGGGALLRDGSARLAGGDFLGRDMIPFARAVEACADGLLDRNAAGAETGVAVQAPRFPAKR